MKPAPQHDDEAVLRAFFRDAAPPLADDGFSRRVLGALPASEIDALLWRRLRFCVIGSVLGSACAAWGVMSQFDPTGASQLVPDLLAAAVRFTEPRLALAFVVTVGSLLFAFGQELRERLFA